MNLVLLEADEIGKTLPRGDRRWEHVRKVLRKGPGESLAAGIVGGALGTATILALDDQGLSLDFRPEAESPPLAPLRMILGFPRPIQANRILKELSSLGVAGILLCQTELGEKSYLESDFFSKGEWRRALVEGAEQARTTRLPEVTRHWGLAKAIDALGDADSPRVALHPAPDAPLLGSLDLRGLPGAADGPGAVLAVGSERGWTRAELALLSERGFLTVSLGGRILKSETAAVAATVLLLGKLGLM